MNERLTRFSLVFELLSGGIAFGALFASPFDVIFKLLSGSLILLFAHYMELQRAHQAIYFEAAAKQNEVAFQTLEAKLNGVEGASLSAAYESHSQMQRLDDIASGQGVSYGVLLCGKFAAWLAIGAALATYVIPELLRT